MSAAIIREAKSLDAIVAIEDLTGIRERTNQPSCSTTERRRSTSWAFYQLRQFLTCKGIREGVEVVAVNPAIGACCLLDCVGERRSRVTLICMVPSIFRSLGCP